MKKYVRNIILLVLCIVMFQGTKVFADSGPHSSVHIKVEGIEGQPYYVTLLSKTDEDGPWSSKYPYDEERGPKEVWEKFHMYQSGSGYYFLGKSEECSNTNTFDWEYFPPDEFKILIYLPKEDRMICSTRSYTRYAFHSYYTVKLNPQDTFISEEQITQTYNKEHEIGDFLLRLAFTILVELVVAWMFAFRTRRQVVILVLTNVLTQGILNLLLNVMHLQQGPEGLGGYYLGLECLVFIIEGVVYQNMFVREEGCITEKKVWVYALVANVSSFVLGLIFSILVPSMYL